MMARVSVMFAALWLAACQPMPMGGTDQQINTDAPVPVALLVPGGSGESGDETLGRALRQAAELAVTDLGGVKIDLRVYNTAGSPATAAAMASKAVDEGAKIILGPLHGASANAAAVAVAPRNVNVLAFTNNTDLAGGNLFVLGPSYQNTAKRLVSYARARGLSRFAVARERNVAGDLAARAVQTAVARTGGGTVSDTSYELSQQGIVSAAPTIAAQSHTADALFLSADTAGALPILSQMLIEQGMSTDATRLIGLTRWDVPAGATNLPGLQGGWFALPDTALTSRFEQRYTEAYGTAPHWIAGLAYDGIAAVGALVKSGRADALTRAALTRPEGFVGVAGIFRLRPDGTNERGLAVAEIREGRPVVIDPAPRSFAGPGF
ncbi:penicillin-binding protein activator [Phaeovulum vinaykumarii]|nr:penicillin-binding protein activator [Phaeovulum vinaykumarii]